ncbi:MAG: SDR family NAD(P)-dependent oxidoreductase [Flammeovirgaceae bacterium]
MSANFDLTGKVAIVTGASKGIGEAIARSFGKAGAKVVISSRKQDQLDALAEEYKKEGIEVLAVAANTGKTEAIEHLVKQTIDAFGGIDILVNNAATNPIFGPATQTELSAYDKIMEVNVRGPFYLSQLVYPSMKSRGGGSIINISSVEGLHPGFGLGAYSISKAALIMQSNVLAKEWGLDNIRVNSICPGLIKTKFSEALWSNDSTMKMVMTKQPIKRIGETKDISGLALFLASDAGSYTTGATMTVDGGLTI